MENFDQQVHESTFPGSTGCQAVLFRQPAEINVVGKLPANAGKLPALLRK